MLRAVVFACPHGVFNRESALPAEVVLAEQLHNVCKMPSVFNRHYVSAFFGKGCVHAYGNVDFALVKQAPESFNVADCGYSDAFRTPCESPRGCQDFERFHHSVKVVGRLAHAHEHDVCQIFTFVNVHNLIYDAGGGYVAVKAVAPGHAECAVHAATCLTADAQGGSVSVRNHYRLDISAGDTAEYVLGSAVSGSVAFQRGFSSDSVFFGERRPGFF